MNGSRFFLNVSILTVGTMIARVVGLISMPVLTRMYDPAAFKLLAVYMASLSLVTVVAGLRFYLAIPLAEHDREANRLLVLSVISSCAVAIALQLLFCLLPAAIVTSIFPSTFRSYLWMIPIGVFVGSIYQALQFWSTRKRRFTLIAKTRIARSFGGAITQVGMGSAQIVPFGLLLGHLVYTGLGCVALSRDIFKSEVDRKSFAIINARMLGETLWRYRKFPIFSVPEALLNAGGAQIPILIIAASSNSAEAGYLGLAILVVSAPLALIGRSVAQVYLAEAPGEHSRGQLQSFTKSTTIALAKVSVLPMLFLGVVAPWLFPLLFGESWSRAGVVVVWLIPYAFLQFVASPVSTALHVAGKLTTALLFQLVGFVARVCPLILMVAVFKDSNWLTEIFAVSSAIFYFFYLLVVIKMAK